jgi:hypothetical protein
MKRLFFALALSVAALTACGGGGGGNSGSAASTTQSLKVSLYGNPLVSSAQTASAKALMAMTAVESQPASAPGAASDAAATVQTLTDALASRGVPATITPQVMDGTTLHQIIMGENNGLPPTPDQFKTDPSEWLIVNFALDDMVTPASDPNQVAAAAQFAQDLTVFTQRAAVSGKRVFVVYAIPTCDTKDQDSAADGLNRAIASGTGTNPSTPVGGLPYQGVTDSNGVRVNATIAGHMGADCRTPDASLLNMRTQSIADDIANRYKAATSGSKY